MSYGLGMKQFSTLVVTKSQVESLMTFAFLYQKKNIGGEENGEILTHMTNGEKVKLTAILRTYYI